MYYFYCINVKEKAQGTFLWNKHDLFSHSFNECASV